MADWKRAIAKLAHRVETRLDEQRERLGLMGGRGRAPRLETYRTYGSAERAWVRGRVLRGAPAAEQTEHDGPLLNLAAMIQRFESDEVPNARVAVRFPGGEHEVRTSEEGYFECWVEPRPPFSASAIWHTLEVELLEPREGDGPDVQHAQFLVPPPESAFGVISDLDDTVIRTDVTSTLRMMKNVFLHNARTRMPFTGVAAFYRALQKGTGASPFNPVFYVSSSPWNLHDVLTEFLMVRKIPLGPLMLRDWGLTSAGLVPGSNAEHKLDAIRRILGMFPALPFLLIGDSGQEDPEIYHQVVREHPDRIRAVYIRNVTPHPARLDAIRALVEEVEAAGSALVLADDTLAAARHAAEKGWISPDALSEIGEVAHAEGPPPEAEAKTPETKDVNRELSVDGSA